MADAVANWYTTTSPGRAAFSVRQHRESLVRGLDVDGVDEDLCVKPTGARGVAQPEGVAPDRIAAVQDGHEVVNAAHGGVLAARAIR